MRQGPSVTHHRYVDVVIDNETYEVKYFYTPARPGRFSGPPEFCYPDEPQEIEIIWARCYLEPVVMERFPLFEAQIMSKLEELHADGEEYVPNQNED